MYLFVSDPLFSVQTSLLSSDFEDVLFPLMESRHICNSSNNLYIHMLYMHRQLHMHISEIVYYVKKLVFTYHGNVVNEQ